MPSSEGCAAVPQRHRRGALPGPSRLPHGLWQLGPRRDRGHLVAREAGVRVNSFLASCSTLKGYIWRSSARGHWLLSGHYMSCDLAHTKCVAGPGFARRADGAKVLQLQPKTRCVIYIAKSSLSVNGPLAGANHVYTNHNSPPLPSETRLGAK